MAYNKYTMELRYPVILKPSSQIYVLGFLEGGNAFDSWKKFSPFRIKRSAGFGVRLYLPVVGMLGIDWGYGFDAPANQTGKSGSQIHFMMGQQFLVVLAINLEEICYICITMLKTGKE